MANEDAPASEQFNLQMGQTFDVDVADIEDIVAGLEQAESFDAEGADDETLADYVAALKALENAAEEARKDVFEAALTERIDEGETIGNLRKTQGTNRYVTDDVAALEAVEDAGHEVHEVAKVSAAKLEKLLGEKADDLIDSSHYNYFRRQS